MTELNSRNPQQALTRYLSGLRDDVRRAILTQHFSVLRDYARRSLAQGESLSVQEERDRQFRMSELLIIGRTFNLTEKQLVAQLYRGVFEDGTGCDCHECRREEV